MKIALRIDHFLAACECFVAIGLFAALAGVLTLNILLRNLAGTSLPGAFEIAATLVLWLALVGGSLALRGRQHIKIEFLRRYLPAAWHRWTDLAVALFGLAVMGVLLAAALFFTAGEVAIFGRTGWLTVIFPIFFLLAAYRFGLEVWGLLSKTGPYRPQWPPLFTPKTPPAP